MSKDKRSYSDESIKKTFEDLDGRLLVLERTKVPFNEVAAREANDEMYSIKEKVHENIRVLAALSDDASKDHDDLREVKRFFRRIKEEKESLGGYERLCRIIRLPLVLKCIGAAMVLGATADMLRPFMYALIAKMGGPAILESIKEIVAAIKG